MEYKFNRIHAELKRQSKWDKDILSIDTGNEETEKILDQIKKKLKQLSNTLIGFSV
ncbi:hypothetical protein [Bacillus toyonensis]|uniref:hypothetical protein n=1 Tax=Bacillus toyonensis TaxID=155322 RepID=UPI00211D3097|nr:hypothetical protein [Bacillus toyonensis]